MSIQYWSIQFDAYDRVAGNAELILAALKDGAKSKAELQRITQLSYGQTKYAIEKLQAAGKVYKLGENCSPNTKYAQLSD